MPPDPPHTLHGHAARDLRFIRDAMERSSVFTAVPGWGGVWMGLSAVVTAVVSGPPAPGPRWLGLWLADAALALAIGLTAIARKAHRADLPLSGAVTRRFLLALVPSLVAGAALTVAFVDANAVDRLPACWLLTYGAAVTSGGAHSVKVVPALGAAVMATGVAALFLPAALGHWCLGVGFGGLQIACGWHIARYHGG